MKKLAYLFRAAISVIAALVLNLIETVPTDAGYIGLAQDAPQVTQRGYPDQSSDVQFGALATCNNDFVADTHGAQRITATLTFTLGILLAPGVNVVSQEDVVNTIELTGGTAKVSGTFNVNAGFNCHSTLGPGSYGSRAFVLNASISVHYFVDAVDSVYDYTVPIDPQTLLTDPAFFEVRAPGPPLPEPSSFALLSVGGGVLAIRRRRSGQRPV